MRYDVYIEIGPPDCVNLTLAIRGLRARTRTDARYEGPKIAHHHLNAHNVHPARVRAVRMECLALIQHPEFYSGPSDPDWDRLLDRLRIEQLVGRVRDWIDGYLSALDAQRRVLMLSPVRVCDCDYWLVRDMLRDRCYSEMDAAQIALAAVALPSRWLPPTYTHL